MVIRLTIFLILTISSSWGSEIPITLEQVSQKVSNQNFLVLENAERVYQGKERIKYSRANLLPKLNIWNILKVGIDFGSLLDIVQDVAPFLVPSNWFKVKQSQYSYQAIKEQYRALWANEINTAKLLFLDILRDENIKELIRSKLNDYKGIMAMARSRNIFGGEDIFSYNLIRNRYLAMLEDERSMKNLVFNEEKQFQYILGINSEQQVKLVKPQLPSIEDSNPIKFERIVFKAMAASPEINQYKIILESLHEVKGQIYFNVLGVNSFSVGMGNGVFDNVPIQDGLGFGFGPSINIAKSEARILKLYMKAALETLKKEVNVIVNEYNSLISNYTRINERIELSRDNYDNMMSFLTMGGEINALEMMEVLDNLYSSQLVSLFYKYRFTSLVEKLKRITFSEDYSTGPKLNFGDKE